MYDPREVLEICEKVTPGPWRFDTKTSSPTIKCDYPIDHIAQRHYSIATCSTGSSKNTPRGKQAQNDAEFIALARTALPQFAQRVIELETILMKIEWLDMSDNPNCLWLSCPYCDKSEIDGHSENCKLNHALATKYKGKE